MTDMSQTFSEIYHNNFWRSEESVSGTGSTREATRHIRKQLPRVFEQYGITSVLDLPCGDLNWMSDVLITGMKGMYYIGGDVVPEIIAENRKKYDLDDVDFFVMDAISDPLPAVDLIFCRDMLGHFSNADVKLALKNFRASGSKYLLTTTFPQHVDNTGDIETGQWRPINLAQYFGLGNPLELIWEGLDGKFSDKSLGLWRIN